MSGRNHNDSTFADSINRVDFLRLMGGGIGLALIPGALTACGGGGGSGQQSYSWRLGFNTPRESVRDLAAQRFKKIVEEESNGRITIDIFPAEQLGSEQEMLDSVRSGGLELQMSGGSAMSNIIPQYATLALPFIVDNFEEAYAVLDGRIGDRLKALAADEGFKVLSHHDLGFAHITNSVRPIEKPADLQGIKMRSPEEPTLVTTFETLGAAVSTLPFTEVYPALQQGVIDGQFNPLDAIFENKFHEVQDYLTLIGIFYYHVNFIMNKDLWDGLDSELQDVVQKAADESKELSRRVTQGNEQEFLKKLQGGFKTITENPDKAAFREKVDPAYDKFKKGIPGNFIAETRQFIEEYRGSSS